MHFWVQNRLTRPATAIAGVPSKSARGKPAPLPADYRGIIAKIGRRWQGEISLAMGGGNLLTILMFEDTGIVSSSRSFFPSRTHSDPRRGRRLKAFFGGVEPKPGRGSNHG